MGLTWSQMFPPAPALTEANLPRQTGKVFLVTGGSSGVGRELCRILYQAGGKVYMGGRSATKAEAAIADIKARAKEHADGDLIFLHIELDDLASIKPAVQRLTAAEQRLDVLFLNAGVSNPPAGSVSKQGHNLTLATNCYGHQLLSQLLKPLLVRTAQDSAPGAVRVVWTASIVADTSAPTGGMRPEDLHSKDPQANYTLSKTGNWFQASDLARQVGSQGVLSVVQNPGNLKTELLRHMPRIVGILVSPLLHPAVYGAYTELWAGLSPDLTIEDGGKYILPWGRLHPSPRKDLLEALKSKDEGGTGVAADFVEHCNREIEPYQ